MIILAFGLWLGLESWAETVTWQEPMIFELDLDKPGVYESAFIPTEGIITSIIANWDFQGKVTLEITTDGGRHYLSVVNGVPEKEGLVQGNQLGYRVRVAKESSVSRLTLAYTDTSGIAYTFGNPQLSGFPYRLPIYIAYSGGGQEDLFNYPVKLTLPSRMKGLNGAVRFTAADGKRLLPYYRESKANSRLFKGDDSPASIDFWVRIPQISKQGVIIYLYYGNPKAGDLSCAEDVFDFFDDFKGKALDEEKWQFLPDLKGVGNLSRGKLFLKDSEIQTNKLSVTDNSLIEFKAQVADTRTDIQAILNKLVFYSSSFPGAQHAIAQDGQVEVNLDSPIEAGQDYIYQISRQGFNLVFARKGHGADAKIVIASGVSGDEPLQLGLKSTSTFSQPGGVYFDWLRVRPFFEAKPCIVSVGSIEPTNLAQYTDEYYVSQRVSCDFPVRIIVVDAVEDLSISADGGRNYTLVRGLASDRYYYASKDDFQAGESLCWKMAFDQMQSLSKKISLKYYPGRITLLSPNGGEQLFAGAKQEILWSAEEYERTYPLRFEYSLDAGKTYNLIAEGVANTGSYLWGLPQELKGQILIKISDLYALEVLDVSDEIIEIK